MQRIRRHTQMGTLAVSAVATLRRISQAAADQPLLLALDDLHWADPDSLTFLHLLCRRARALPVAVVATLRPWPDSALRAAEQLATHGLADIHWLAPLTDEAAREVLRDHVGDIGNDVADRVVAACDGNPLLLELTLPDPRLAEHGAGGGPGWGGGNPATAAGPVLGR